MSRKVIEGLVMPGGWHYADESGVRRPYKASSYRDLLDLELRYRLDNNLEVGDVQADIDEYICRKFPQNCQRTDGALRGGPQYVAPPKARRLIDDLLIWGLELYDTPKSAEFVMPGIASARASICAQCRENIPWDSTCKRCVDKARRIFSILRRGKEADHKDRLLACRLNKWDNRTAVWLAGAKARATELPERCWAKQKNI